MSKCLGKLKMLFHIPLYRTYVWIVISECGGNKRTSIYKILLKTQFLQLLFWITGTLFCMDVKVSFKKYIHG